MLFYGIGIGIIFATTPFFCIFLRHFVVKEVASKQASVTFLIIYPFFFAIGFISAYLLTYSALFADYYTFVALDALRIFGIPAMLALIQILLLLKVFSNDIAGQTQLNVNAEYPVYCGLTSGKHFTQFLKAGALLLFRAPYELLAEYVILANGEESFRKIAYITSLAVLAVGSVVLLFRAKSMTHTYR